MKICPGRKICAFCEHAVFNDERGVGSVIDDSSRKLVYYHLNCLYDAFPLASNYDVLAVNLFDGRRGNNPCGCGIPTCMDGELCGMPPRRKDS